MKTATKKALPILPLPIKASDLVYPSYKAKGGAKHAYGEGFQSLDFELWYTERLGWCIPTLQIRHAGAAVRGGYWNA